MPELVKLEEAGAFACGRARIGHLFIVLNAHGDEVASGVVGSIHYRADWTVHAIVSESGDVCLIPIGSHVCQCLTGFRVGEDSEEEEATLSCSVSLADQGMLNLGISPAFL